LPAGGQQLVLRSLSSARLPYPALLLGRSAWTAVDLLYSLPGIPMTFGSERDGLAFRVDVTGTYAYNSDYLINEDKKRSKRIAAEVGVRFVLQSVEVLANVYRCVCRFTPLQRHVERMRHAGGAAQSSISSSAMPSPRTDGNSSGDPARGASDSRHSSAIHESLSSWQQSGISGGTSSNPLGGTRSGTGDLSAGETLFSSMLTCVSNTRNLRSSPRQMHYTRATWVLVAQFLHLLPVELQTTSFPVSASRMDLICCLTLTHRQMLPTRSFIFYSPRHSPSSFKRLSPQM
jgi:hypothetical protein